MVWHVRRLLRMTAVFNRLRSVFTFLYIYFVGIRFYDSTITPTTENTDKIIIKTFSGYDITFYFFKEKVNYIHYYLGRNKKAEATIYVITADFGEKAPESIKRYNSVRLWVNDSSIFVSDPKTVNRLLLNAYLDFISNELVKDATDDALKDSTSKAITSA